MIKYKGNHYIYKTLEDIKIMFIIISKIKL